MRLGVSKYKFPILAKPSGITLDAHRNNVMSEGSLLVQSIPFTLHKYREITGKDLARRVQLSSQFHDEGKKISKVWQQACQDDHQNYVDWQKINHGKSFKEYAEVQDVGKNLRKSGVRHEFYSLLKNESLPLVLQVAIAAHHSKLSE